VRPAPAVDTSWLQRRYVLFLFFIELATRQVHLARVTANPNGAWVAQQDRNLMRLLGYRGRQLRLLRRDHDARFARAFDDVVGSRRAHRCC
jgi:putative transposase